jgi:hypothetical protein
MGNIAPVVKVVAPKARVFRHEGAAVIMPGLSLPEVRPSEIVVEGEGFSYVPPVIAVAEPVPLSVASSSVVVGGLPPRSDRVNHEISPGLSAEALVWLRARKPSEWKSIKTYSGYDDYILKAKNNYTKHKDSNPRALPGQELFHATTQVAFESIKVNGLVPRDPRWRGMATLDSSKDGYLSFSTDIRGVGTEHSAAGDVILLYVAPGSDAGVLFRVFAGTEVRTTSSVGAADLKWKPIGEKRDIWDWVIPR